MQLTETSITAWSWKESKSQWYLLHWLWEGERCTEPAEHLIFDAENDEWSRESLFHSIQNPFLSKL